MALRFYNEKLLITTTNDPDTIEKIKEIGTAPHSGFKGKGFVIYDDVCFVHERKDHNGNTVYFIPSGLWKRYHDEGIKIDGLDILTNKELTKQKFNEYVSTLDLPFSPYDHQLKHAWINCYFKSVTSIVGTSGGKTFITFLSMSYMIDKLLKPNRKILAIVPSIQLASQFHDDFYEYQHQSKLFIPPHKHGRLRKETKPQSHWIYRRGEKWEKNALGSGVISEEDINDAMINMDKIKLKTFKIHNNAKNMNSIEDCNVVVSTYHSLQNKSAEFFNQFDMVFVDEVHGARANGVQYIMSNLRHVKYKFGLTGSMPDNKLELMNVESYIGSCVAEHKVHTMRDNGDVADFEIITRKIIHRKATTKPYYEYLSQNMTLFEDVGGLIRSEQEYIFNNTERNKVVSKLVCSETMNTILLTRRVGSAENLYKECVEYCKIHHPNKKVWIINGGVPLDERLDIITSCKKDIYNNILVGSVACIGTGMSVNELFSGYLIGIGKARIATIQCVGRLIRKHKLKKVVPIHDISDILLHDYVDIKKKQRKGNYSKKYQNERIDIYEQEKYKIKENKDNIYI